jgi:uncharacterized protein YjdB
LGRPRKTTEIVAVPFTGSSMKSANLVRAILAPASLLLLASCGGGGGGGGSNPGPAPTPTPTPVPPAAQVITFAMPGPVSRTFGDAVFTNAASGGEGSGAITYSSGSPAVATVDAASGQVTITGAGSSTITASKAADTTHLAATANYTLNVARAAQSIAFATAGPVSKIYGEPGFTNLAGGGAGSGSITYSSSDSTLATVSGATDLVTIVGSGTVQIRADKAESANHLAAQATYTINIAQAAQTVSFAAAGPLARTFGDPAFSNVATAIGGTGALSYASSNPAVAAVDGASGLVTVAGAGNADITATKAADANHTVAQATYGIVVARAAQGITFDLPGPIAKQVGDAPFSNVASGGAGTGAVSYASSDSTIAAVNAAGRVTIGAAGTAIITATKAASANHLLAQASFTLNVTAPASVDAPFIAWLNISQPATVYLPSIASGATFSRALSGNCTSFLTASCSNVTSTLAGATAITEAMGGLGRSAQYWLTRGTNTGRPVTVDARRYTNALFTPVEFLGQLWLVGANDGAQTWSSTDARAWVQRSSTLPWGSRWGARVVVFNNRLYFIGGSPVMAAGNFNDVWASDDGLSWTRIVEHAAFSARGDHEVVVFNGRMWLIGGYDYDNEVRFNDVWSSTDGVTWTQATANGGFTPRRNHRVAVLNGRLWMIAGTGGLYDSNYLADAWSSADGVSWSPGAALPFGARSRMAVLVRNNRLYALGGYDGSAARGDVWSTTDGLQWRQETAGGEFGVRAGAFLVAYRNHVWLLGGNDWLRAKNDSWRTDDLVNWTFEHTSAPFSPARPGRLMSFANRLWMVGPASDGTMQAWWSSDGNEWTQAPGAAVIPTRNGFAMAVNNGRLWLQGGYTGTPPTAAVNDVWSTADGETWSRATAAAPFPPRLDQELFAMNGKLFMVGGQMPGTGQYGDIWSSIDGASWVQETANAAFTPHYEHQIVVFNGKAWLLGGKDNSHGANGQIWSSIDGVNWQFESTQPQAAGRYRHRAVVHANRIWIVGGETGNYVPMGDTWYSSDGVNWTQQLTGNPGFTRLSSHGLASFDGKLWIYGGEGVNGETDSHQMWWSTEGTDWNSRYRNQIEVP